MGQNTITREDLGNMIQAELRHPDENRTEEERTQRLLDLADRYAKSQILETLNEFQGYSYERDDQIYYKQQELKAQLGLNG